ncbi:MAG: PTPA-CTERM sorting domain-containing protein [Planctomycetota bacterium]
MSQGSLRTFAVAGSALAFSLAPLASADTIVRFDTAFGSFDVQMLDDAAPLHVANFLEYVNAGDYDGTVIHRSVPGFIVQGGRFNVEDGNLGEIDSRGTVVNEPGVPNKRGTLAAAKLGGDPDSASREWFFNLDDNTENLDNQNGGFTVFGRIVGSVGRQIVDQIAALPIVDVSDSVGAFGELPVQNFTSGDPVGVDNLFFVDNLDVIETDTGAFAPLVPEAPDEPADPIVPPSTDGDETDGVDPGDLFEGDEGDDLPGTDTPDVGGDLPDIDDGNGDAGDPTAIPTPSAVLAGLAGLGLLASRRRRD